MREDKYTYLAKNTAIFAIGTFGSKILTFLIVPLYTYVLSTEDYGNIDLFTTTISLMLPFITFTIYEAIIRFLTTKEIDKNTAISSCMIVFTAGTCIILSGIPIYKHLFYESGYVLFYIVLLITSSYNQIFSQCLRALGDSIGFSINGIIVTIVTVFANLFLLLFLHWGIYGYFYSLILAQLFAGIQATIAGNIFQHCSLKYFNYNTLKRLLKYSIPLIPNNLMWWIMSAGDKYMIYYFIGSSANGIYSLSMKIPTILNLLYSIFMQAWQLSAIREENNSGQDVFYSNIFKLTSSILMICSSVAIIIVKPLFSTVMGKDFIISWKYVPLLCIAMIIGCFSTFAGVVYMVRKTSEKFFTTTLFGAVINLLVNYLLIKWIGLYGAALGTAVGYMVVFLIRANDAKREIGMHFDMTRTLWALLILILQTVILIVFDHVIIYLIQFILLVLLLWIYRNENRKVIREFMKIIHRNKI